MGVFGVWCGKCAKYLAFGTFTTPAVDALMMILTIIECFMTLLICYTCLLRVFIYTMLVVLF